MRFERILAAVLLTVATATVSRPAGAQDGCQGCVSSSSCSESTTRTGCTWGCQGSEGVCACGDAQCNASLVKLDQAGTTYAGGGYARPVGEGAYAIASCNGDVHGVAYTAARARQVEGDLAAISLQPVATTLARGDAAGTARPGAALDLSRFRSAEYVAPRGTSSERGVGN